jgi:hypothetical protein
MVLEPTVWRQNQHPQAIVPLKKILIFFFTYSSQIILFDYCTFKRSECGGKKQGLAAPSNSTSPKYPYVHPSLSHLRDKASFCPTVYPLIGARVPAYMRVNGRIWCTNYRWLCYGQY